MNRIIPYFAILGIYLIVRSTVLGDMVPMKAHGNLSAYQIFINAFALFAQHIGKLLLPIDLNVFHVLHPISSLLEFRGVAGVFVTAAYAAAVAVVYRKNRTAFLGLVLIVIPLLPALYIPALGEASFAERYLYTPSAGFVVLLAASFAWLHEKLPRYGIPITLFTIALIVLYSVQTVRRNTVWKDDLTLFSDTVRKSPEGELPNGMFGVALMNVGRFNEAIEQLRKTLKLHPNSVNTYYNLGRALMKKGLPAEAIPALEKALTFTPDDPDARRNLAYSYLQLGMTDKAFEQFRILAESKVASPEAHLDFGVMLRQQGKTDDAIESYRKALALDPSYAKAHFNLGNAMRICDRRTGPSRGMKPP